MHRFKELQVWKSSRIFCKSIYEITASFPNEEKFGLVSQLRRANVSIASNIAEGAFRRSNKDFYRFLEIAIGSTYEIKTQLLIATDLDFMN
ncbi:four helix bundle protein [Kordia sp.]|uniref:four helix bundle protein n=1 Tax=Kordia sp. TaxID=1965332 RepID=UPI003D2E09B2